MIVPTTGLKGAFEFDAAFSNLNNKILEVTSIRTLSEMYNNGDDPCSTIYIKNGLTKDDYLNDLQSGVPIAVFTSPGAFFYYIPCNKILKMPDVSGVPYSRKLLVMSLGSLPYDFSLEGLIENTKDLLRSHLSTETKVEVLEGSSIFYRTYEEHERFTSWIDQHPFIKNTESYRIKYLKLLDIYNALKTDYDLLTNFMINTWRNNVVESNRPTASDLLTYTKKIAIEYVAHTTTTDAALSGLLFSLYNSFNESPRPLYANSFTKINDMSYHGMLDKVPMTITVTSGLVDGVNIPNIFSDSKSLTCKPQEAVKIVIELEEAINLRSYKFVPYLNSSNYCGTVRIVMYNDINRVINKRQYTYGSNNDFSPINTTVNSGLLQFSDYEDVDVPLTPPS